MANENELRKSQTEKNTSELYRFAWTQGFEPNVARISIMYAYVKYLMLVHNVDKDMPVEDIIDAYAYDPEGDIRFVLKDFLKPDVWNKFQESAPEFSASELKDIILDFMEYERSYDFIMHSPESIVRLALKILDIQPEEKVLDLCSGSGDFLTAAMKSVPEAHYYGKEIESTTRAISMIRTNVLKGITTANPAVKPDVDIYTGNAFDMLDAGTASTFDKIFIESPLGLRLRNVLLGKTADYMEKNNIERFPLSGPADGLFSFLITKLLKDSGRAIGVFAANIASANAVAMKFRKYLVKNGLIECVISLPPRMFLGTGVRLVMFIFSHNNKKVHLIDATDICQKGRRYNTLSDDNIAEIMDAYVKDGQNSVTIDNNDLLSGDCILLPSSYLIKDSVRKVSNDGRKLGDVIREVYRGAPISAKRLDELASKTPTSCHYLMLKNIHDGMIDEKLPYLKGIDKKAEKFLIRDNMIIMSKIGSPYKLAVAHVENDEKILATGNLYMIEVNQEMANPHYIKAFLESAWGQSLLARIETGSVIRTVAINRLLDLVIPVPSMEKQNKIVEEYIGYEEEIRMYQKRIERATAKKAHIFEEYEEG